MEKLGTQCRAGYAYARAVNIAFIVTNLIYLVRGMPAIRYGGTGAFDWPIFFHSSGKRDAQIVTNNHKKERVRITRKKLANDIAKRIEAYLMELEVSDYWIQIAYSQLSYV
jgi:hypothetical protein